MNIRDIAYLFHEKQPSRDCDAYAEQDKRRGKLRQRQGLAASAPAFPRLARASEPEALHALEVAVLPIVHQVTVELGDPGGTLGKSDAIAGHGIPGSYCQDVALVVLSYQVLENGGVVDEGVQAVALHRLEAFLHCAPVVPEKKTPPGVKEDKIFAIQR